MKQKKVNHARAQRRMSASLRLFAVLLALTLNFGFIFLLTRFLQERVSYVYALLSVISAFVALRIFNRHESPGYKYLWILLIAAMPVAGLILYLLLANAGLRHLQGLKDNPEPPTRESLQMKSEDYLRRLRRDDPSSARLASYLMGKGFLLYRHTETLYFPSGEAFFEDIFSRMAKAERFIFLEYYIIAEGELWDRAFRILREKAAQGVEVKIIFDDFGNISRFSAGTLAAMEHAGIEYLVFNPVHRYVSRMSFNYRDHRKIAVIDGDYAYTGGINFADEYANLYERFGHWRDSALRLHGPGVWGLSFRFIHLWEQLGGTLQQETGYYEPIDETEGEGYVQCVFDSPLNNPDNPMEDVYTQLIYTAKRFLYITTPYLALEEDMLRALSVAAEGGVDVRLMLPGIPDKKSVFRVAESYFDELLRHGVKVYLYTPGFLHNKSVMVDRELALIGSPNMDFRSFQFNFEDAVLCYGTAAVEELLSDMDEIMAESRLVSMDAWEKRSRLKKFAGSLLRLFAFWM